MLKKILESKWLNYPDGEVAIMRYVLSFLKPHLFLIIIGLLCATVYGAIDGLLIRMIKDLLDEGFVSKNQEFLNFLPLQLSCIFILRSICGYFSQFLFAKATQSSVKELRYHLFQKLILFPHKIFEKHSMGELISRICFNTQVMACSTSEVLTVAIRELVAIIVLIGVMFSSSVFFSIIYMMSIPISVAILSFVSKKTRIMNQKVNHSSEKMTSHVREVIQGQLVIKSFGGYIHEQEKFQQILDENYLYEVKQSNASSLGSALVQLVGGAALTLIISLSINWSIAPQLSAGEFTCLVTAILALLRPLKQLTRIYSVWQKVAAAALTLIDYSSWPTEDASILNHIQQSSLFYQERIKIQFHHVTFFYESKKSHETLAIDHLTVEPGETVAIVGPSGGGKSTLVSLLPKFNVASGNIMINDVHIDELPLEILREKIAIVSQDVILFNDTIAANIAYGQKEIDWTRLKLAAQFAYAHDFIKNLPNQYETVIGENGANLSGGQRQRIALARAFYKKAPILILDEATSALDPESEEKVQEALVNLMQQSTTIVIAHRLSTIINADKIIVIDHGRIVEQGNHASLIRAQGVYYQLYKDSLPMEKKFATTD